MLKHFSGLIDKRPSINMLFFRVNNTLIIKHILVKLRADL